MQLCWFYGDDKRSILVSGFSSGIPMDETDILSNYGATMNTNQVLILKSLRQSLFASSTIL